MAEKKINDIIQDAIDSQDYSRLSNSIQDLVTDAVTSALGELGDNVNKAADIIAGRVTPIDRRPDYMKNASHPNVAPQNPWRGSGQFEQITADYLTAKDVMEGAYFTNGGLSRWKGLLYVIGGITGLTCTLGGLLSVSLAGALIHTSVMFPQIILVLASILLGFVSYKGFGILSKLKRFKTYIKTLGKRVFVPVKELAGATGKSEKNIVKDLKEMIDANMFLQGHLDAENKTLYVTDEAYQEYRDALLSFQTRVQEEAAQLQKARQEKAAKEAEESALSPEVRKLLQEGDHYIQSIKESNDAIADAEVTAKLNNLQALTEQIFRYVKDHPESADETKKLMKYYLPTTIKLLDSYEKLSEAEASGLHPEQTVNIQNSKKEIEETLDTLNQAFARLFDNLYQDTSVDIKADISVLNTLLSQDGLTDAGMDIEKKQEEGLVLQSH